DRRPAARGDAPDKTQLSVPLHHRAFLKCRRDRGALCWRTEGKLDLLGYHRPCKRHAPQTQLTPKPDISSRPTDRVDERRQISSVETQRPQIPDLPSDIERDATDGEVALERCL